MGIAEIQAALAQGATANPFATPPAAPAPAAFQPPPVPVAFQPNPFAPPATAAPNAFGGSPAPAPVATGFAFDPPPGFNPASAPPINPVGERASLNTPAPTAPAPVASFTEPQAPAKPKRRGRKPKAEAAAAPVTEAAADVGGEALASPAELVLGNISTEDLVAVLRDRGYSVWLEAK